jgi:hypothetical protein
LKPLDSTLTVAIGGSSSIEIFKELQGVPESDACADVEMDREDYTIDVTGVEVPKEQICDDEYDEELDCDAECLGGTFETGTSESCDDDEIITSAEECEARGEHLGYSYEGT